MKKRIFALLIASVWCVTAFAEEPRRNFIDFDKLKADADGENSASLIDLTQFSSYQSPNPADFNLSTSLAIENWRINLASSAKTPVNINNSYMREVTTEVANDLQDKNSATSTRAVMGVRVRFPKEAINSFAEIKPPFQIPIWGGNDANPTAFQQPGFGVIMNMGVLKEVTVRVCGRNSGHHLQILVEMNGATKALDMGPLNFIGWRDLKWTNPNYIVDVQDRVLTDNPLYPGTFSYARFLGFRVVKDIDFTLGETVFYVDSVSANYDLARPLRSGDSIDDESVWGIEETTHAETEANEFLQIGRVKTLEYLEQQKLDQTTNTAPKANKPTKAPKNG